MSDKAQGDWQLVIRAAQALQRETQRLRMEAQETVNQATVIRARAAHTRSVVEVQRLLRRLKTENPKLLCNLDDRSS